KKLKYRLLALPVAGLGIGGDIVYELKFKTYDTGDPEVDALTEETYNVELPDGTVIVVDKDGNIVENNTADSDENDTTTASANTSSADETNVDSTNGSGEATEAGTDNGGSGSSSSNAGQTGTTENSNSGTNPSTNTGSGTNGNPKPSTGTNTPTEKVTVASIKKQYEGTFKS